MESLLQVVAELMAVPLLIAAALLFEALGVGLIGVGQLLTLRRGRPTRLLRWWKRFVWTATGVLGLVLASLVLVDLLLFEPGLRLLLEQVERASGVDLCFERARGSLFTGAVELEGVSVRHAGSAAVDLEVEHLAIDVAMLRGVLGPAVPITELRLRGVRGDIARRAPLARAGHRRDFVIERVVIEDLQLDFEDLAGAPVRTLPIDFETLEIAPLRSEYALLDLFCHSAARGRARGHDVTAERGRWRVRDVPLSPQGGGKLGPAGRWFRGGVVDLDVACPDDQADPLSLQVDLALRGFQVAPPGDTGRRLGAAKIASALGHLGPRLDVHFTLDIGRDKLRGATAAELGLWDRAVQAWNLQLGGRLGLSRDELLVLGIGSRAVEKLRQARPRRDEAIPAQTH